MMTVRGDASGCTRCGRTEPQRWPIPIFPDTANKGAPGEVKIARRFAADDTRIVVSRATEITGSIVFRPLLVLKDQIVSLGIVAGGDPHLDGWFGRFGLVCRFVDEDR